MTSRRLVQGSTDATADQGVQFDSDFDFMFRPLTHSPVHNDLNADEAAPIASIELETLPAQLLQVLAIQ